MSVIILVIEETLKLFIFVFIVVCIFFYVLGINPTKIGIGKSPNTARIRSSNARAFPHSG